MPLSPASALKPRPVRRRLGIIVAVLLLTLLAHLLVIEWLKNELQLIAPTDDDDEPSISITLQSPEPVRPPAPPPEPAHKADGKAVAAVPKAQPAATAPEPAPAPVAEAQTSAADSSTSLSTTVGGPQAEPARAAPEASPEPPANALFERVSPPPSAELQFNAAGIRNDGRRIDGRGIMEWRNDGQRYSVSNEISVLMITLAKYRSEGELGKLGVAPLLYVEKRIGRSETNTHFQRDTQLISFSASTHTVPATGGEQDRGSWMWQLASLGRGDPGKFEAGLSLEMVVAGTKMADVWRIYVNGLESVALPDGEVSAWRMSVIPGPDSFDKQIDLWLAPERNWYPVKLQHQDKNGNRIELLLTKIIAK
jgi:hypothetical protein